MKKIIITGNAGSGKTTLTSKIAKILDRHEVISLDKIVWKSGWQLTSKEEKELQFTNIISKPSWIVDGVSKSILEAADTIIFLDYPRHICYFRALLRNRNYMFRSRPELPKKCPEILALGKLIKIIWNFPNTVRPVILNHINENTQGKRIFHVTNNKELLSTINEIHTTSDHDMDR